jgi:hypothetical protein
VATTEEVELEPDLFVCETCPVQIAQAQLWPENLEAWAVFQRLARRLVVDTGIGSAVFSALMQDREDVADMVDRLSEIYEIVLPPPERK